MYKATTVFGEGMHNAYLRWCMHLHTLCTIILRTSKTFDGAGPRIINVGIPGPGAKRLMWRRAWRDKILPALINFAPDLIFVSAGFDAHKKVGCGRVL